VKIVNGEQQLQALVDGKKIVITEASVRRDLQLDDEEGTDCLPNATIFEELARMGYEKLWYILYHNTGSILGSGWFLKKETLEREYSRERKCFLCK
ncbi:hypothetical protein Tco_0426934, partial [Tanacetum coccineum]